MTGFSPSAFEGFPQFLVGEAKALDLAFVAPINITATLLRVARSEPNSAEIFGFGKIISGRDVAV